MGYTTEFEGSFKIEPAFNSQQVKFLQKLSETRRMIRNVGPEYGVDGEFYVDGIGDFGQGHEDNIVDHNQPPSTQPSLWLQWNISEDGTTLAWDGGEKFYDYIEWLVYYIETFILPADRTITGSVEWVGEDSDDRGVISIADGRMTISEGDKVRVFEPTARDLYFHTKFTPRSAT
jgi:hypothetical protein